MVGLLEYYTDKTILLTGATGFVGKFPNPQSIESYVEVSRFNRQGDFGENLSLAPRCEEDLRCCCSACKSDSRTEALYKP